MKIMTLNVWQGRLERVLLKHLETLNVDFACLQEAIDYDGMSGGLVSGYKTIGKSLSLDNQFFSPLMSMRLGNKTVHFGNVTFANVPFDVAETKFTRGEYKNDFNFDVDDYNIRAFQHTQVTIAGKKLHVLNHHGHHIDAHKLGDAETLRQVTIISDYIKQLDGAVILCGDFNLAPESDSIKHLEAHLRNLSTEYRLQTTRSKLTSKNEVCDYIFVNDDVRVNNFVMDETIVSDHNALILDFEVV